MYLPPYQALLSMLSAGAERKGAKNIVVPEQVLKMILQMALSQTQFDENAYLKENPDVADAVRRGVMPNANYHYVNFGYFEKRPGGVPVDTAWYEKQYPDVALAIRSGKSRVKSALEHFDVAGAAEGRAPNASSQFAAQAWRAAIGGQDAK